MSTNETKFADALKAIDRDLLNNAFDLCNQEDPSEAYDRTALNRWLGGAIPSRRSFVERLSRQLGRNEILETWAAARVDSSSADVKNVVTRFRALSPENKPEAFRQIREDHISSAGNIRTRFSMRIDLHDGEREEAYDAQVSVNWDGFLPAKATTAIVTDYDRLGEAFDQRDCIFRDIVHLDDKLVNQELGGQANRSEHTLSYRPIGPGSKTITHEAALLDHGHCEFPNDEVERATVHLRVRYPFPRGTPLYPIMFQGYRIGGIARITLAIHSKRARNPRGYAFLGPGRQWEASTLGNELVIDAGTEESYLGDETGIVLHWTETDLR